MVAAGLLEEFRNGGLLDEATLPLETISIFLGVSEKQVRRKMEVVEVGARTTRVKLGVYRAFLAQNTKQPAA